MIYYNTLDTVHCTHKNILTLYIIYTSTLWFNQFIITLAEIVMRLWTNPRKLRRKSFTKKGKQYIPKIIWLWKFYTVFARKCESADTHKTLASQCVSLKYLIYLVKQWISVFRYFLLQHWVILKIIHSNKCIYAVHVHMYLTRKIKCFLVPGIEKTRCFI